MTQSAAWRRALLGAALIAPVVLIGSLGWLRRWTADDAFINYRIVQQLRAGHGPVFNIGERIEAGTSPLWIFLLAVCDLLTPIRLEWIALLLGLGCTVGAVALGCQTGCRAVRHSSQRAPLLPLGMLVYACLPPAWDFATSGLETGLGLLWLAASFAALSRPFEPATGAPPWRAGVLLGLGPLIRPDFVVYTLVFAVAGALALTTRRARFVWAALALGPPALATLMRAAYFGLLVPNTALAKEAATPYWSQGWRYLGDFALPYALPIPLLVLALLVLADRRTLRSQRTRLALLTALGAVLHALYIVRVGGDYMHGRLLLPSLFALLLPVAVTTTSGYRIVAATAVCAWAGVTMVRLRPAYSSAAWTSGGLWPTAAIDPDTGIGDERRWYVLFSGDAHPVTTDDYANTVWVRGGAQLRALEAQGVTGLVTGADVGRYRWLSPTIPSGRQRLVAYTGSMGMYGYVAGNRVDIVDSYGLGNALASHTRLLKRRRIGHEKGLTLEWVIAAYANPESPIPLGVNDQQVADARAALQCAQLRQLTEATSSPLSLGRLLHNAFRSIGLTNFRFDPDPGRARTELCS